MCLYDQVIVYIHVIWVFVLIDDCNVVMLSLALWGVVSYFPGTGVIYTLLGRDLILEYHVMVLMIALWGGDLILEYHVMVLMIVLWGGELILK